MYDIDHVLYSYVLKLPVLLLFCLFVFSAFVYSTRWLLSDGSVKCIWEDV